MLYCCMNDDFHCILVSRHGVVPRDSGPVCLFISFIATLKILFRRAVPFYQYHGHYILNFDKDDICLALERRLFLFLSLFL